MFLATLIVAAKYLNDSSPKNKHWTRYAILFDNAEINLMESQLLFLLDFDLRFSEKQAIEHFAVFMPPRQSSPQQDMETRQSAVNRIKARRSRSNMNVVQMQMPLTPPHDAVPPSLVPSKSSSGHLDVPSVSAKLQVRHQSPTSSASSPMEAMSRCTTAESELSMGALTEDNGSSGSEAEDFEDDHNLLTVPDRLVSGSQSASRISFVLPPKPPPARRNPNRCSSYNVSSLYQRRTSQPEIRGMTHSSSAMTSLPRIRESMSSGFLSRMFGVGTVKDKENTNRVEKDKGGMDTSSLHHRNDVIIASESSLGLDHRTLPGTAQIIRPQRYPSYDNAADFLSL